MDYRVLGPLEVVADGEALKLGPPRQRAVLGLLVLHAGEVVSVDRLVDGIWGASPPPSARQALRLYVAGLRRILEPSAGLGHRILLTRRPGYLLAVETDHVDARRFEQALEQARASDDATERHRILTEALDLWRGGAYADFAYDDFAAVEIRRLEELRLEAHELRISAALELGRQTEVLANLEELIAANPLRENLRRMQMLALYRADRQAEALQVYQQTRRLWADELGIDPSDELRHLEGRILLQDASLKPGTAKARHNLPTPAVSFVGRAEALDALSQLVERQRIVTVTGPPGVGKTRLALEVASRSSGQFPDGTWLVELAPCSDPALVTPTLASVLGVLDLEGVDVVARLIRHLDDRRVLAVLDNCEHVVDEVAELLVQVTPRAPGLHVLATSREVLRIAGEFAFPLDPMPVPDPGADLAQATTFDSVRLFAERAVAADPRFELDTSNTGDVIRACGSLDGLPLAIELAAARVHAISTADIARGLEHRFGLLAHGERGAPAHHRTLEDAVAWSYELADPRERQVFRRLSVFVGGFTGDAAAMVVTDASIDAGSVVDILASLVDKSLVTADTQVGGRLRYGLLGTMQEFGQRRLEEAGEVAGVRRRHAQHFTRLAESADANLDGPEQVQSLRRLVVEHDNLRAALRWALDDGSIEAGLRLATALGRFWNRHGDWSEARRWLEQLLEAAPEAPVAQLGMARHMAGTLAVQQNDVAEASRHLTLALDLLRSAGDLDRAADTLNSLASLAISGGDIEGATQLFEEALRTKEEAGTSTATMLINLGWLDLESGDAARAADRFEAAQMRAALEEDLDHSAWSSLGLGVVAWLEGDLERAEGRFHAAAGAWTQLEASPSLVYAHVGQALVLRQRGRVEAAAERSAAAIECALDLGGGERNAFALGIVVSVLAAADRFAEAAQLMASLQTLAEAHGWPIWSWYQAHLDSCLDRARLEIGEDALARRQRTGRGMSIEDAFDYALSETRGLSGARVVGAEDHSSSPIAD